MEHVIFDFYDINSLDDFYHRFAKRFELPEYFGNNLDALWDVIMSGYLPAPVSIEFVHTPLTQEFQDLVLLFLQASEELADELIFQNSNLNEPGC